MKRGFIAEEFRDSGWETTNIGDECFQVRVRPLRRVTVPLALGLVGGFVAVPLIFDLVVLLAIFVGVASPTDSAAMRFCAAGVVSTPAVFFGARLRVAFFACSGSGEGSWSDVATMGVASLVFLEDRPRVAALGGSGSGDGS
jgi:hypothetical protein